MMWASVIVASDSRMPTCVKSRKAETPATISGVTSGTSISTFALGAARARPHEPEREQRAEERPDQHRHERDLEARDQRPAQRLVLEEARYHSRLTPSKFCSERCELNENTTTSSDRREQEEEEARDVGAQPPHAVASRAARAAERR